ncbi:unnamed protein product [Blepharisma stoltei]|uniref:C2H2-type domain-containing protein n=1 Tax=Blepharisma stoltei TaxID=1481888 RepID=A0AAU9JU64_9CILI|nr:unnamed protein product [Blepharisma stoltei]
MSFPPNVSNHTLQQTDENDGEDTSSGKTIQNCSSSTLSPPKITVEAIMSAIRPPLMELPVPINEENLTESNISENQKDEEAQSHQLSEGSSEINYFAISLDEEIIECPCCDSSFTNKYDLKNHLNDMHVNLLKYRKPKFPIAKKSHIINPIDLLSISENIPIERTIEIASEIENLYEEHKLTQQLKDYQELNINVIEKIIQKYYPNSKIQMYGSNANGFGTLSSDLDLSLSIDVLDALKSEESFDSMAELFGEESTRELCEYLIITMLCRAFDVNNAVDVNAIDSARVKIVHFKTPRIPQLDIDISLNNDLAVENSRLLYTYSRIDERVEKLGIAIKVWAKKRSISDPKNGTLSSYALIILVIYFLQQQATPILPILQSSGESKLIKGFECMFDCDFLNYQSLAAENKESLGYLLFEFFKFYAIFEWNLMVVDITTLEPRYKTPVEQMKTSIYIQDPFETKRNLGDVCSLDGANLIKNEFAVAAQILLSNWSFSQYLCISS